MNFAYILNYSNMETQIVRLDAPYNLLCNKSGSFALHIATLIVIMETETRDVMGVSSKRAEVNSFPVVQEKYKPGGKTWEKYDLNDCLVVCSEGETVSLQHIKRVFDFCHNRGLYEINKLPRALYIALKNAGCTITLPTDKDGNVISDYVVNLRFSYDDEGYCIIMNDADSKFFFYGSYSIEPGFDDDGNEFDYEDFAIEKLAELRHLYLLMLGAKGLKSIVFTTKDDKHLQFVEKLNSTK